MQDCRLEIIESTIDNISKEVVEIYNKGVRYTEYSRIDNLLDEWAGNIVKYYRINTELLGFKTDKKSTKTKELHKMALIEKYNSGTIKITYGGGING